MNLFGFFPGYEVHVYDAGREPAFLLLVAFILTLAGTRFYTPDGADAWLGERAHRRRAHASPRARRRDEPRRRRPRHRPRAERALDRILAIVFGAGAALVLDEFAMLLHLDDVYWTTEGRSSIDACLAAVAFIGLAILATLPLPTDAGSDRLARVLGDGLIALAACFVVVTILKGKLKLGLLGIVFAPLAIVGAVRLAKPSSIWARRLYPQGGRRLRRSEARSESRAERWTRRRERFYDLIGGAPHLGSKRDSAATPK